MAEVARVLCAATQSRVLRVVLMAHFKQTAPEAAQELQDATAMSPHTCTINLWCL